MVEHSPSGYNTLVDYQKLDEDSDETLMVTQEIRISKFYTQVWCNRTTISFFKFYQEFTILFFSNQIYSDIIMTL